MREAISCSRNEHCWGSKTLRFRHTSVSGTVVYRARSVGGNAVGGAGGV